MKDALFKLQDLQVLINQQGNSLAPSATQFVGERPPRELHGIPFPVCPRNHDMKKCLDHSGKDLACKKCGTEMINCEPFFWQCLDCDRNSPYHICHFCIFDCQPPSRHHMTTATNLDTSMNDSHPSPKRDKNALNECEESSLTKMLSMSSLNFEPSTTLVSPNLKPLQL